MVIRKLNDIAANRGQSLSQMALSWVLRENKVTTVLIGASRKEHILNNIEVINNLDFSDAELQEIDRLSF